MVLIILLLNIKYHFRSGDSKQRSQGQIRMKPIFAKLALWAHSHSCLFRYCLWLLPCYNGVEYGNPLQHSCLEKSHGQRILAGYSPWGEGELDRTKQLTHTHRLNCIVCRVIISSQLKEKTLYVTKTKECREKKKSVLSSSLRTPNPFLYLWEPWTSYRPA